MNPVIKILLTTSIFSNLAGGLFGPIYALFVKEIGGDILNAGAAWAIYLIFTGLFTIIFSNSLAARFSKENLIFTGYFLHAVGTFGFLLVDDPIMLFIVQAYQGLTIALLNPAWDAVFSLALDKKKELKEWSLWEGTVPIVRGIAALLGSYIAFQFSFKTLFFIMGLLALTASAVSFRLKLKKYNYGKF